MSVEDLLIGRLPGVPRVVLHHPVTSVESGDAFMRNYEMAAEGKLNAPYVIIFEGSVPNEDLAAETGGYWCAMGSETVPKPIPTTTWLADGAGGGGCDRHRHLRHLGRHPGRLRQPDRLDERDGLPGKDYLSALGLPVVNVPGCAPIGDNFTETVAAILLFLNGLGPLPEFDELGRPAWLFNQTVHQQCVRAGFYEEGTFAERYGDPECLVEIGCWGPVVQCNITSRGAINHVGGCMNTGGVCIGCTMPGFPDRFAPFYKRPPGTIVSSTTSRTVGSFVRPLRRITMQFQNREPRWDKGGTGAERLGQRAGAGSGQEGRALLLREVAVPELGAARPHQRNEGYDDGYELPPACGPARAGGPPQVAAARRARRRAQTERRDERAAVSPPLVHGPRGRGGVVVAVAAALLLAIIGTARILATPDARWRIANEIVANTRPIWDLERTNSVAAQLLEGARAIEQHATEVADALDAPVVVGQRWWRFDLGGDVDRRGRCGRR